MYISPEAKFVSFEKFADGPTGGAVIGGVGGDDSNED